MKKKILWSLLIVTAAYFTWCKTYTFNADKLLLTPRRIIILAHTMCVRGTL